MKIQYESRKFIDLILTATSRWANWNPSGEIKVGDYGKINKETGEFVWEGNIYSTHFQDQLNQLSLPFDMNDPQLQSVAITEGDQDFIVCSNGKFEKVGDAGPQVGIQDIASVTLRVNFKFNQKIGAGLAVYRPQISSLPKDERITNLLKARSDVLKGKYLVTEVMSCRAYALVMSNQKGEEISASLSASGMPIPGITLSGGASMRWTSDAVHGLWRSGSHAEAIFRPLYTLRQPRRNFWERVANRGEIAASDRVENWHYVRQPPWDPLTEDGEEDVVYDAAFEGEELDWD